MSERTAPALAKLDVLMPLLHALPESPEREHVLNEAAALQRAVRAFHMEAIRFRMYSVDRLLASLGAGDASKAFEDLRQALEAAGFHTRSH
jgi:hypothetical protein